MYFGFGLICGCSLVLVVSGSDSHLVRSTVWTAGCSLLASLVGACLGPTAAPSKVVQLRSHVFGNYGIIQAALRVFIVLAHLKRASVNVKVGDLVSRALLRSEERRVGKERRDGCEMRHENE